VIDLARRLRPDLVLMDIVMPGLDGPSTLKRMRAIPAIQDIPLIFLTARVMPAELKQVLKMGALGVIAKPFDPLKLGDQVFALWRKADIARAASLSAAPAPHADSTQIFEQMDAVARRFLERASKDIAILRKSIERAGQGVPSALAQVERIGHSLSGTGAMLGYLRVSALGESLERLARESLADAEGQGPAGHSSNLGQQLRDCTERLALAVETAADTPPTGAGMLQLSRVGGSSGIKQSSSADRRVAPRDRKPFLD
jgi:CheY-like chemotaxis protein